jgi:hypothetical protein
MNEKEKYELQEAFKRDKEQTLLSENGISPNTNIYAEKKLQFNSETLLICPFCLEVSKLKNFIMKERNRYLAKCSNCKQEVQFRTLFNMLKWSGKEFADFVFPYTKMGFWNKVSPDFKAWNLKLKYLNMSYDFWERYKALRGDSQEDYEKARYESLNEEQTEEDFRESEKEARARDEYITRKEEGY